MPAFALAHLHDVDFCQDIVTYLQRIDETLRPFGGRFRIHGAGAEVLEGSLQGDIVVIEFPDLDRARSWYRAPAYQAILPLRTRHSRGFVVLLDGVDDAHRATDILSAAAA